MSPADPPSGEGGGRPAVFLDRDGTVITEKDYLDDPTEVELVRGVPGALRSLRDAGFLLVVVTNQSGIARGYYSEADYRSVAARVNEVLEQAGVPVDATYYCPHHPSETGPCTCRKPGTGMHRRAADRLGIDLARSWFVGDKLSDLLPARELGGRGILVRTGFGRETEADLPSDFSVADDLPSAARRILGSGPDAGGSAP